MRAAAAMQDVREVARTEKIASTFYKPRTHRCSPAHET
jgi:hypothetical protein